MFDRLFTVLETLFLLNNIKSLIEFIGNIIIVFVVKNISVPHGSAGTGLPGINLPRCDGFLVKGKYYFFLNLGSSI